ncbi:MAG: hypothetical protein C4551_07320 [Bacillota bacterium]|jgi:hypothetical protein|nr:MAG: hypothetical protein C4551_07320 [Bacillota bacterium]
MPGFVGEEIEPVFEEAPALEKKTGAPSGFRLREREYKIQRVVKEWHEYNQSRPGGGWDAGRPPYAMRGVRNRGSWGQGKDFYRVLLDDGRLVDIYYDRRPKSGGDKGRKGRWVLFREIGDAQR